MEKSRIEIGFEVYARHFDDAVVIVGTQEIGNPHYAGKANPAIEVMKNTGEIMSEKILPVDDNYWGHAAPIRGWNYSFIVHELGGREKILARLEKIAAKK